MAFNPQFNQAIVEGVKKALGKGKDDSISRYKRAKESLQYRRTAWNNARSLMFMALGVLSAGFGLEGFLIPNGLIDGGVTGISLLTNKETGISLSILILLINIPFLLLGWKQIGKGFSIKSILCIAVLAVLLVVLPYPVVTNDKVLIAVFGGFFLGAGIGLTIRGGAVIDGTEILAIFMSRKRSISVGDFILLFNIVIFSVAAYLYSVEMALYSILTYMAAAKTVDFILEGIEEFTGVTIISPHTEAIGNFIKNKMGRGLTVYTGKKGYGKRGERLATEILFTVVTRLEISRLKHEIEKIDPNAFIVMQSVNDTHGGMVKKRPLKQ
ncbi:MAG: YitT family protein [Ferruginibacter sp.]|nr:YitT family protein [Chitinophagaceae bacterium]